MLIAGVERNREETAGLPLEALLRPGGMPNRRGAAAVEHIVERFVDMPLRMETLARRNADHVGVVLITGAVKHDVNAMAAHSIPPLEWNRIEILDTQNPR